MNKEERLTFYPLVPSPNGQKRQMRSSWSQDQDFILLFHMGGRGPGTWNVSRWPDKAEHRDLTFDIRCQHRKRWLHHAVCAIFEFKKNRDYIFFISLSNSAMDFGKCLINSVCSKVLEHTKTYLTFWKVIFQLLGNLQSINLKFLKLNTFYYVNNFRIIYNSKKLEIT